MRFTLALLAILGMMQVAQAADDKLQEAQTVLTLLGLKPGKTDGNMTPTTAAALTKFQQGAGLAVTGKLDDRTLEALRTKRDTQFTKSLSAPSVNGPQPVRPRQVESKPVAAPVQAVQSETLGMVGGAGRTMSQVPPPIGGTSPSSLPPSAAPRVTPTPSGLIDRGGFTTFGETTRYAPPAEPPAPGLLDRFGWVTPLFGLPIFYLLWAYARRNPRIAPIEPELLDHRREPSFGPRLPDNREPRLSALS